jgi:16S rRNA (uracil1498-N3)-methyltransferase
MKKIYRFITNFDIDGNLIKITDKKLVHQMVNVLRLRNSESVIIGKGDCIDILAKILKTEKDIVFLELQKVLKNENEPQIKVNLFCSILKKENFELVAQKAVEAGVFTITPIITERTIKTKINFERVKIIKEATEQSGRGIVPQLNDIISFEKIILMRNNEGTSVLLDPYGEKFLLPGSGDKVGFFSIFIGPEGGWTEREIKLAKDTGFKIISLGPLIMRSETSAIVATFLFAHSYRPNS